MFTVRDLVPSISYSKLLKSEYDNAIVKDHIENLQANTDKDVIPPVIKPTFIKIDGRLYMAGDSYGVIFGSSYFLQNPDTEYRIDVYESAETSEDKFESTWGMNSSEYHDSADEVGDTERLNKNISEALDSDNDREWDEINERVASTKAGTVALAIESYIKSYKAGDAKGRMLYGHTGISKSAVIKQAVANADKSDKSGYGFRLVDLRAGFLDKTDLMGYAEKITKDPNDPTSTAIGFGDSPNTSLLSSSDAFVSEVRDWLVKNKAGETDDNKHFYNKMR